jgi:glycolate oxidase FAD binding subunit
LIRPDSTEQLERIIAEAAASGAKLELRGGGSKAEVGAPREAEVVDMTGFAGILDYDPAELVLTARAGTPLAEVEAAVAEKGQMLAFEPFDHGPLFRRPTGAATIGGVIAAGVSGSRRLSRGAARDHLLGFKAVSGRGEAFVGGGKVVKNVTGYDLCKVMAGSWGRLAALTEVTLKVLPRPQVIRSLMIPGLDPRGAVELMSLAMGSQADVAAAAHAGERTVLRLEGVGPSVEARARLLQSMAPDAEVISDGAAQGFWAQMREPLLNEPVLWRISVRASRASTVIKLLDGDWMMDWAGGLIWSASRNAAAVRSAAEAAGGHATLIRAPEALRREVPALHPPAPGVAALEVRVRRAFDPMGVFETGRF